MSWAAAGEGDQAGETGARGRLSVWKVQGAVLDQGRPSGVAQHAARCPPKLTYTSGQPGQGTHYATHGGQGTPGKTTLQALNGTRREEGGRGHSGYPPCQCSSHSTSSSPKQTWHTPRHQAWAPKQAWAQPVCTVAVHGCGAATTNARRNARTTGCTLGHCLLRRATLALSRGGSWPDSH